MKGGEAQNALDREGPRRQSLAATSEAGRHDQKKNSPSRDTPAAPVRDIEKAAKSSREG